ncbi:Glycosyltransferase involved in cell wall bisynthesis [Micromonospora pallida]|uniref:Glycosyltransferase involved in cell wall bisynthesis n=1 Tax=Micromonospora pallida TaxID=145854 RepID=A0A1C6THV2_9ACTN|nr:glycosyltransferase family 4 protein [Micromonospora pallida]SCL41338.1 Glycosyltransferase involved in cell wall bisynthesis [Micromonospora pallida]
MLVDNGVHGDSRVQKAARSAAVAGWDVTLLGRSPDGEPRRWRLGRAEVRLLPMGGPSTGAQARRRRAVAALGGLRRPVELAYTRFWSVAMRERAWRRLEPSLWQYERAYGPVVDALDPDLIHAHDFRMLGVAARAKLRARDQGRSVKLLWDAHEFLPGIKPWRDNVRWLPAHRAHEREYAPYADAVVTVSDELARLLQAEHGLTERPAVVLNAPDLTTPSTTAGPGEAGPSAAAGPGDAGAPGGGPVSLRERCGIGPDVPLLVYSGAAAPQRGLAVLVEALPALPDAHVAFVVNRPDGDYVQGLVRRAAELGVADRLHVGGYVAADEVVPLLAGADVGVIPIEHWPNHEIALITKFFEYSHARLPIVVSDVRTMAETVRRTGQGEVFRAGDPADLVRAVRAVLADPGRHRAAYEAPGLLESWSWPAQAAVLDRVYTALLPDRPAVSLDGGGQA